MTEQAQWLHSMLVGKGVISEAGLSRHAGLRTCRRCRRACLAAIDSDGLDAWLHPDSIHAAGELLALLDGRVTYSLFAGREIVRRDRHWIRAYPAGVGPRPAFAVHQCDRPVPAAWTIPTPPARPPAATKEMPF